MWQHNPLAWLEQYGISWVIVVVGLMVATMALFVGRWLSAGSTTDEDDRPNLDPALGPSPEQGQRSGERRAAPRRGGNPIEIEVTPPEGVNGPTSALVHDRSLGGLGLIVQSVVQEGTILQVSTRNRHKRGRMSVPVRVLSCKRTENGWELGCRFERQLTYHELSLFE